jgi:hypothetical protein
VEGKTYRWIAKGSLHQGYMLVTIQEEAKAPGRPVRVKIRGSILHDFPFPTRLGDLIPDLVLRSIKAGWQPSAKGETPKYEFEL